MPPRRVISDLLRTSQTYLFDRAQRMRAEASEKKAKEWLKPYILENGEPDESGHLHISFDEPLAIEGKVYSGIVARRNDVPYLKTDEVEAWLGEHGLLEEIRIDVPATFYYDYEMVYILNQEGKIPDEVIDSFEDHRVSWSLWPRE